VVRGGDNRGCRVVYEQMGATDRAAA